MPPPSDTAHPEGERELLPCPFCGGEQIAVAPGFAAFDKPDWAVMCKSCGVYVDRPDEADALTAWNTRPVVLRPQGEEGLRDDDLIWLRASLEQRRIHPDPIIRKELRPENVAANDRLDRILAALSNQGKPSS